MVSICKRLINVVKLERAENAATRPEPKGNGVGTGTVLLPLSWANGVVSSALPANRADLTCRVTQSERGKPDAPPERFRQANRKVSCWGGGQKKVEKAKAGL